MSSAPAARSAWTGSITFGMVSVPVRANTTTDSKQTVSFKQWCPVHDCAVKSPKVCEKGDHPVATTDIAKGFEISKGKVVLVTADELAAMPLATTKELKLSEFVPADEVSDPLRVKQVYYLSPEDVGAKAYAMLAAALHSTGRAGLGKVAITGGREQLAALTSDGTTMRLVTLYWPDELRTAAAIAPADVSPAEVLMASQFIDALSADYDATKYVDEYRAAVVHLIENKVAGIAPEALPASAPVMQAVDLMAQLKASVEAAAKLPAPNKKAAA